MTDNRAISLAPYDAVLLLSFGGSVFRAVLFVVPGAKYFRYPEKFVLFVSLAVCVLALLWLATAWALS